MARKKKRDMDDPVNIDMGFDKALDAMLNDSELPPLDEPVLQVVEDEPEGDK